MIRYNFVSYFVVIVIGHCTGQKIISDEKWAILCRNVPARVYTRLPGECSRFFICIDGYPSILDCPDNLYFDPEEVICGYPGDIKCYKDVEEVTTMKDTEETTKSPSTTTTIGVWTHEMTPKETEETEPESDPDVETLNNNSQVECCQFFGTRRVCSEC